MPRAGVRVPGFDVQGWMEVGRAVGLHRNTCRKLSELPEAEDPLPVRDYFGAPVAVRAELLAWVARRVAQRSAEQTAAAITTSGRPRRRRSAP